MISIIKNVIKITKKKKETQCLQKMKPKQWNTKAQTHRPHILSSLLFKRMQQFRKPIFFSE